MITNRPVSAVLNLYGVLYIKTERSFNIKNQPDFHVIVWKPAQRINLLSHRWKPSEMCRHVVFSLGTDVS